MSTTRNRVAVLHGVNFDILERRNPELTGEHAERLAVTVGALAGDLLHPRPSKTETLRQSSRASTSERWTSTAGSAATSSASAIARL